MEIVIGVVAGVFGSAKQYGEYGRRHADGSGYLVRNAGQESGRLPF
jgi:hypothetical protein